jgi:hypothetical protein
MDREQIELQLDRIWQNHKESRPRRPSPPPGRGCFMAWRSGNQAKRLRLRASRAVIHRTRES